MFKFGLCSECCQGSTCLWVDDAFTRADSTTIGGDGYTQAAGAWSLSTGHVTTQDTSALLIANTSHPLNSANMHITCDVRGNTAGDQARVCCAVRNTSNLMFAEVTFGTTGRIALVERVNSTNTTISSRVQDIPVNTWHTVVVCNGAGSGDTRRSAGIVSFEEGQVFGNGAFSTGNGGNQAGVGTGTAAGTIDFDNLQVSLNSTVCQECQVSCSTACAMGTSPPAYQVTYTGITNGTCTNCTQLNATFIVESDLDTSITGCLYACILPACYSPNNLRLTTNGAGTGGYRVFANAGIGELLLQDLTFTSTKACDAVTNLSLSSHGGANTICVSSNATCVITALTT